MSGTRFLVYKGYCRTSLHSAERFFDENEGIMTRNGVFSFYYKISNKDKLRQVLHRLSFFIEKYLFSREN